MKEDLLDWLYTGLTGRFQIAGHRQIDRWSSHFTDKIVLDIGCGHGHHLHYCENSYSSYIGLDLEHKFLKTFQNRFPNTILVQADAYDLSFHNNSIDCVLSIYNFEHLRRLRDSLGEIHRVLKPTGELMIGLPLEGGYLYGIGRWFTSKIYMERKYGIDYDAIVHWEHWNDFWEIIERVKEKFRIVERCFIPFPFFPFGHVNVIQCLRTQPKPSPKREMAI